MTIKLSVASRVNVANTSARSPAAICPVRSLIERADENSVATQSLMARSSNGLLAEPSLHASGLCLVGQRRNQQRRIEIEHQYRPSSRIRRIKSRARSDCTGIASVIARNAGTSMGFRGMSAAMICATGLPRRVMHTGFPAAASSTSSLKCAFASARLTVLTSLS